MAAALLPWTNTSARAQTPDQTQPQAQPVNPEEQRTEPPAQRIPQQQTARTGALQGLILDTDDRSLPGVRVQLSPAPATTQSQSAAAPEIAGPRR